MSSLGPNEPYPEEGQMADLRTVVTAGLRLRPAWNYDKLAGMIADSLTDDFIASVEDVRDERIEATILDLLMELS